MAKQKEVTKDTIEETKETVVAVEKPDINSLEWNDYVLSLLSEEEKIKGNPTTDGLRRVIEVALNCVILEANSNVVQSPTPENEKRATVVHTLVYYLLDHPSAPANLNTRRVTGTADVYWGNCDKVYRNHPVAVAETRAEGRALRRALRLRKVVAAEELTENTEDHPDGDSVDKISEQQINFIDVMSKRSNVNIKNLLVDLGINPTNIKGISHNNAVVIIRELSKHQQNLANIPEVLLGYDPEWRLL